MVDREAQRIIAAVHAARRPLRQLAGALGGEGLARETFAGWTGLEMLAHVAFWEEAAVPVVRHVLRGEEVPLPWQFGSGPFEGPEWPPADVHNAREAAWARTRDVESILERWDRAHEALLEALETVPDAAAIGQARYVDDEVIAHLREHFAELRGLAEAGGTPIEW